MCKQAGLNHDDLEIMTIGMCIDYVLEYAEWNKPEKERKARKAQQGDFDSF